MYKKIDLIIDNQKIEKLSYKITFKISFKFFCCFFINTTNFTRISLVKKNLNFKYFKYQVFKYLQNQNFRIIQTFNQLFMVPKNTNTEWLDLLIKLITWFIFLLLDQPEQPTDFRVVNITRNSITLQWTKNFDGGDPQRFRIRYRKDDRDPTYRYIETESAVTSLLLDNLETATRYVINIQSLNKFGTDGFLRDPIVVQTDFGFDEVNQLPIYNENNLPLTIILVVCGVGTSWKWP